MAKKILISAPQSYETSCGDCGTRFSYELEDIIKNYNSLPRQFVICPNEKCGARCSHFDQRF